MLDNWSVTQATLETALKQIAAYLTELSPDVVIACLIVPIVVAVISRRILTILAVVLLTATSLVILLEPAFMATTAALASYCGSVIVALMGLASWRRDRAPKTELAALRADVDQLVQAESRRMMVELRSTKDTMPSVDPQTEK